jgi:glycosyltransferase involved in cell wall biosynthesis
MIQDSSDMNAIRHSSPAKVSTIIAAYNAEQTIAQTIESALAQNFDSHEIVVVNDGSTDSTAAILEQYSNSIRAITQTNRGAAAARNTGVVHSTGKYIAILDSDDLWQPGKLKTMVGALERNPHATLAFSEYTKIDEHGTEFEASSIEHAPSMEEMMRSFPPILTSTLVIRRERLNRCGGLDEKFKVQGFEDLWLLLLLRELGEFVYVPDKLTRYRVSAGAESADKYVRGFPTFVALVRERYGHAGKTLIRSAKNMQCRWMLSKIAHQMDRGDRLGALTTLVQIAGLRPAYLVSAECLNRLFLPQNVRRVRELTWRASRARC